MIGQDFDIDLDGKARYYGEKDNAEDPLFSWVSDDLLGICNFLVIIESNVQEALQRRLLNRIWNFSYHILFSETYIPHIHETHG